MAGRLARWMGNTLVVVFFVGVVSGLAWGLRAAALSPLFQLRVVEITMPGEETSTSQADLLKRVGLDPSRPESLFKVNLAEIEMRILKDPWIESVQLTKQFPQTLVVAPQFRAAVAVFQNADGRLQYLDRQGVAFCDAHLRKQLDLPLVTGFESQEARKQAVDWIQALDHMRPGGNLLDSLHWDLVRGIWAVISGPTTGRTSVWIGQKFDADPLPRLQRIGKAIAYLRSSKIRARRIIADVGEKVIIKVQKPPHS